MERFEKDFLHAILNLVEDGARPLIIDDDHLALGGGEDKALKEESHRFLVSVEGSKGHAHPKVRLAPVWFEFHRFLFIL